MQQSRHLWVRVRESCERLLQNGEGHYPGAETLNTGALIIRMGFGGPIYSNYEDPPPKKK